MSLELSDGNVNLLIGEPQIQSFQTTLERLIDQEGVGCALLLDTAGKPILAAGSAGKLELTTIAALAAGDHATTRALARRVGERDFSLVFQRDHELNVYLSAVGDEALLVVLFDQLATLAAVRVRVKQALQALQQTLAECERKIVGPDSLERIFEPGAPAESAPASEVPATRRIRRVRQEFAMGQMFEVEEIVEIDASGRETVVGTPGPEAPSAAAPAPAASAVPPRAAPHAPPPPDLVRMFWRVKTLAEDCVRSHVESTAPDDWREARGRIGRVAQLLVQSDFAECGRLLQEAERHLTRAYERSLEAARGPDEDWELVELFHHLVGHASNVFRQRLGDAARDVLAHVDHDVQAQHPALLREAKGGMVEPSALEACRQFPREKRRQLIVYAFFELLLNRVAVARKIFGVEAERDLLARWNQTFQDRAEEFNRLGLIPALRLFVDAVERRRRAAATEPDA